MHLSVRTLSILFSVLFLSACGGEDNQSPPAQEEIPAAQGAAMEPGSASEEESLVARARAIHDRVIVLDTHIDINTDNFTAERNYTEDLDVQVNLPKMEEGGMDVAWFVVYTGQGELTEEGYAAAYENAMDKFGAIHRLADEYAPDRIEVAYTTADVRRIIAEGKKAAMIGVENAYPIAGDIARVQEFHELGARYMSLTHNGHNQLADSNTGERDDTWRHNGLSDLGREVVREMNRLGIMIDLSHPSIESNLQAMELSEAPVIASHSSPRALAPSVSRNLTDEELRMVAEGGGVVQAVAFPSYLDPDKAAAHEEAVEAGVENVNEVAPPVDVADFVDHIDYLVEQIGIDHVGVSGDFDGGGGVHGWMDASESFNVTLELVRREYTEAEIAKIWGENLLRVLDDVQAVAESMD